MVRIPGSPCRGMDSISGHELRSHKTCGAAKNNKKKTATVDAMMSETSCQNQWGSEELAYQGEQPQTPM